MGGFVAGWGKDKGGGWGGGRGGGGGGFSEFVPDWVKDKGWGYRAPRGPLCLCQDWSYGIKGYSVQEEGVQ